jgi:DNA-binding PadR family transcriptional regulator
MTGCAMPFHGEWMLMSHGRRGRRGRPPFGSRSGMMRGGPFFGPRRAGRGDIRAAVLTLLAEEPMHGYQIIQELGRRSGGVWQPSPGSVYPTLQQLQDEGLVRSTEADGGKRIFELTDEGRSECERLPSRAPWDEVARDVGDELVELHDAAFQLMGAIRQVAQAGDPSQVQAANEVLREARRRVYGLLAEGDSAPDGGDTGA